MANEISTVALNLSTRRVAIAAPQAMWSLQYVNTQGLCIVDDQGNATPVGGGGGSGITALTGDVTAAGSGSVAATIAAAAITTGKIADANVTLAKIAAIADQRVLGNVSGGSAVPAELTQAQVRTFLGLATVATSGSASDLSSGTLPAARFGPLTGDVTTSGYAATLSATAVAAGSYTYASITVDAKGRLTAASNGAAPQPLLSLTAGSVLFSGGGSTVSQDNNNFYYDSTNKRIVLKKGAAYTPAAGAPITVLAPSGVTFSKLAMDISGGASEITCSDSQLTLTGLSGVALQGGSNVGLAIDNAKNCVAGNQSGLATGATDGFLFVTSSAGAPTGAPTSPFGTNVVPLHYDRTNNKIYVYNGGVWKSTAALT